MKGTFGIFRVLDFGARDITTCHCCNHPCREAAAEGILEATTGIPHAANPHELWDDLTTVFEALKATSKEPEAAKCHWHDWVSEGTWLLIKQCMSLQQAGQLRWCVGQRTQCTIHAALKADRTARTAQVGGSIVADLAKGNTHEAFHHLKGWYRVAIETQAQPCFHTMERQMVERVDLYQQRDSSGPPVPVNVAPVEVWDDVPADGEIWAAVAKLTDSHSAGASRMWAEHLKEWLQGI